MFKKRTHMMGRKRYSGVPDMTAAERDAHRAEIKKAMAEYTGKIAKVAAGSALCAREFTTQWKALTTVDDWGRNVRHLKSGARGER